ncbi:MAG: 4Fe-4S cluster-binding domain-containing protein [Bdellovibrionales bacterium]|nr:4Fe-4S cluster-binding domain-containing protein [Bdellovibrionales bacterium]
MKTSDSEISKGFCKAPWVHSHISAYGQRKLCCISEEPYDLANCGAPQPVHNGDSVKQVRKKILAGEVPSACRICDRGELAYRQHFDKFASWEEIESATSQDGATSMAPVSYDHRFTNLCNLECKMCGPVASTKWVSKINKLSDNHLAFKESVNAEQAMLKSLYKDTTLTELSQAVEQNRVREIYWCGGEPLMWPEHWKILNQLVASGES